MEGSKVQFKTVDDYINSFPDAVKSKLQTLRVTIKETVPDAGETIKYGIPTYTLRGNLVSFAAWKTHIAVYPVTGEMEATIRELGTYKTSGKGTIQFPLNQPLPLPLIRTIVESRVKAFREKQPKSD